MTKDTNLKRSGSQTVTAISCPKDHGVCSSAVMWNSRSLIDSQRLIPIMATVRNCTRIHETSTTHSTAIGVEKLSTALNEFMSLGHRRSKNRYVARRSSVLALFQ